jgi:hypothetical protein
MDGRLRPVTDRTWQGTLAGYVVQVFQHGDGWHAPMMRGGYTAVVLRAETFRAAWRARKWIGRQLTKR